MQQIREHDLAVCDYFISVFGIIKTGRIDCEVKRDVVIGNNRL